MLVTVDFPKDRKLTDEVQAQNKALAEKFGVEGYPTLVVIDPDGKLVFRQDGYEEGGPDAFVAKFPKA